ncbi:response regulator [Piscinibacter sp. XHJ-5]|uniref:response regulator n=1 Tax=Piscinibacter sp. XHJ-5 TaxID=3037797 RepID=UPI002453690D|nr:response regulator [Piscinibacter sp. XHJ-5]
MSSAVDVPLRRILIADDNHDAADTLGALLEILLPCKVDLAYDGRQAVELAQSHRPDVAIFDIAMPRMSGIEAAAQLRRDYPGNTPLLVAVTALDDAWTREATQAVGFDRRFTKPVDPVALLGALAESGAIPAVETATASDIPARVRWVSA